MAKFYYFDTSALLSAALKQGPFKEISKILASESEILSSALIESETLATFKRENLESKIALPWLERISIVFTERSLTRELMQVFESGYCRGADAHHIATALYLDPEAKDLIFVTLDDNQKKVANAAGFKCWSL